MSGFRKIQDLVRTIKQNQHLPSESAAFVYLCLESALKLSDRQIRSAMTHGENDRGIDAVHIDNRGIHIIVCDYAKDRLRARFRFQQRRLNRFLKTWHAIASGSIPEPQVREPLSHKIKEIRAYWSRFSGGHIPHTFYFITNKVTAGFPRSRLENALNYYMQHDYHYAELGDLARAVFGTIENASESSFEVALVAEEADPRGALTLLRAFERENVLHFVDLLPLAILSPVLAAVLLHFTIGTIRTTSYANYVAVVTLLVSYFPYYLAFTRREVSRGLKKPSTPWQLAALGAFFSSVLIGPSLVLTYIVAVAVIIALVTILPAAQFIPVDEWPPVLFLGARISTLVLAAAWVFSGLRPPIPPIRHLAGEIIAGVRRNVGEIFDFAAGLAVSTFLVGGGVLGLIYEHFWESLLAGALSGLMMGLSCRSHVGRKPVLENLARLAQARCLLRIRRAADASRRLREVWESPSFAEIPAMGDLMNSISAFDGRWLEEYESRHYKVHHHLLLAETGSKGSEVAANIWNRSIRNTWLMVGSEPLGEKSPHELVQMTRDSALPAWKRVCAAEVIPPEKDPRFRRIEKCCVVPADPLLGFIEIPEGTFLMGRDPDLKEVILPQYYISRYPTTVHQIWMYLRDDAKAIKNVRSLPPDASGSSSRPVTILLWTEAVAYCKWLERRLRNHRQSLADEDLDEKERRFWAALRDGTVVVTLPSEAEWEKAARGTDGRTYPWGAEPDPERARFRETGIESVAPVGCFPRGASPYGVEDMLGSGPTWTRNKYKDLPWQSRDARISGGSASDMTVRGDDYARSVERSPCTLRQPRSSIDTSIGSVAGVRPVIVPVKGLECVTRIKH